MSARDAAVHSDGGSALSGPSSGSTLEIIGEFLSARGRSAATAASLSIVSEGTNANTGLTHVRLGQQVNGLSVYGTYVKATLNSDGELIHLIELLADPSSRVTTTSIDADDALRAALNRNFPTYGGSLSQGAVSGNETEFSNDGFFYENPTATKVAAPLAGGALQEAYLVVAWSDADNLLYHTLVGSGGQILNNELRTNTDSYSIFPGRPPRDATEETANAPVH